MQDVEGLLEIEYVKVQLFDGVYVKEDKVVVLNKMKLYGIPHKIT